MKMTIRTLDGLPIEEPLLDDDGLKKQRELSERVVQEYARTGTVSRKVCEEIVRYETEIQKHVIK